MIKLLWEDSFVEEANLNVNVSALRRVLGERPNEDRYIVTVPRPADIDLWLRSDRWPNST